MRKCLEWWFRLLPFVVCFLFLAGVYVYKRDKFPIILSYSLAITIFLYCFLNLSNFLLLNKNKDIYTNAFPVKKIYFKKEDGSKKSAYVVFDFEDGEEKLTFYTKNFSAAKDYKFVGLNFYYGLFNGYIIKEKHLLKENEVENWYESNIKN